MSIDPQLVQIFGVEQLPKTGIKINDFLIPLAAIYDTLPFETCYPSDELIKGEKLLTPQELSLIYQALDAVQELTEGMKLFCAWDSASSNLSRCYFDFDW